MDKIEYFECECYSPEHRFVFKTIDLEDEPPEFYGEVFLNTYRNFFKRILVAIKYIFGFKSRYGHFDELTLKIEDSPRLRKLLLSFERDYNKWMKENK